MPEFCFLYKLEVVVVQIAIGAVYGMENFGTVDIDWWARQVSLSVRGMNGEPVRRVELGFGVLGVAP